MKTLILLLFPFILFAQDPDTCKYQRNDVDEFTNDRTIVTELEIITPGVMGYFARVGKLKAFKFNTASDLGCVSSDSYIILKYSDGTTKKINHVGEIDCGDHPYFIGVISTAKKVSKMRIHFSRTLDIIVDNPNFLIEGLKCIE